MFARTERLLLRPAWLEDAPALAEAIADETVARNLARAPWPYRPVDAEEYVGRQIEAERPDMLIFLRTRGKPRLVGGIGLADAPGGAAELGYWITRTCWGLGYATEAARAAVSIAFDGLRLPALVSGHFADNPASGRVLRKLGFRPSGTTTRYSAARSGDAPSIDYRLDSGHWAMPPRQIAA